MEALKAEVIMLQDRLTKVKSLNTYMKRQLEEMTADRDREKQRADSLQRAVRELQSQLRKQSSPPKDQPSKASARGSSPPSPRPHLGQPSPAPAQAKVPTPRRSPAMAPPARAAPPGPPPELFDTRDFGRGFDLPLVPELNEEYEDGEGDPGDLPVLERSWEFVVQGQYDVNEEADFQSKMLSCFPEDAVARARALGALCICQRGRRVDQSVPNQDDFVMARHSLGARGHVALFAVFDGHGPSGHECAAFARSQLPECLFGRGSLLVQPDAALREAFASAQNNLLRQPFDSLHSGTTATVALVLDLPAGALSEAPECWVLVGHVGDCRAVLATRQPDSPGVSVSRLTRDHRPEDPEESARIQAAGGEVRRLRRGASSARIYTPGSDRPVSALTRSLGAAAVTSLGVTAEPEIAAFKLQPGSEAVLVLGTDGLFEFCNASDVATRLCVEGVDQTVMEELCNSARKRWASTSFNETVDDITLLAVQLSTAKTD